jgi:hypothetical protein
LGLQYALELGGEAHHRDDDGEEKAIDYARFLEFSMLRLGMCGRDTLDLFRKQFSDLDVDGDGMFSPLEMHAALSFARFDKDNSGFLDLHEFLLLVEELKLGVYVCVCVCVHHVRSVDGMCVRVQCIRFSLCIHSTFSLSLSLSLGALFSPRAGTYRRIRS